MAEKLTFKEFRQASLTYSSEMIVLVSSCVTWQMLKLFQNFLPFSKEVFSILEKHSIGSTQPLQKWKERSKSIKVV